MELPYNGGDNTFPGHHWLLSKKTKCQVCFLLFLLVSEHPLIYPTTTKELYHNALHSQRMPISVVCLKEKHINILYYSFEIGIILTHVSWICPFLFTSYVSAWNYPLSLFAVLNLNFHGAYKVNLSVCILISLQASGGSISEHAFFCITFLTQPSPPCTHF